ncbi:MAG: hypothetical protein JNN00_12765, partial [Chitinophagaceae bacterium]|nr:hypothetical protein [Chitinophagaceae bacterium]
MLYLKKILTPVILLFVASSAFSQAQQFSLATDVNVLRSFKKDQRFWAIGQTVHGHFHFTTKDGAYAWISYYSNGQFRNDVVA